jgi:peroxiredoxin
MTVAVIAVMMLVGCGPDIERVPPDEQSPAEQSGPGDADGASVVEQPAEDADQPPPPPTIPEVKLTESLAATNRLGVGDPLPDAELPDLDGQKHTLAELFGEKLTVVVFWQADDPYSTLELEDLQAEFVEGAGAKGVRVVAVNVGDQPEKVRQAVADFEPSYPILLDTDGSYFAQIATERLPRTYLLDPTGKILWFDLEYSSTTRRHLEQAVEAALLEKSEE